MNGLAHYAYAEEALAKEPVSEAGGIITAINGLTHAVLAVAAAISADRSVGPAESWGGHTVSVDLRDESTGYR